MSSYDIVNSFSSNIEEKAYFSAFIKTTVNPEDFNVVFPKKEYTAKEYRLFFFKFATKEMFVEKALQDILFSLYDDIYANTGVELGTHQIDPIGDPIISECFYCKTAFIIHSTGYSYYCSGNCYKIFNNRNYYDNYCNTYLVTSYNRPIRQINLVQIKPIMETINWSELYIENEKPKHRMYYKTYFKKDKVVSKKFNSVRRKLLKTNNQKRKSY